MELAIFGDVLYRWNGLNAMRLDSSSTRSNHIIFLNWGYLFFRLIWNPMDVHLVPNQLENRKYNLIPIGFKKISLCADSYPDSNVPQITEILTAHTPRIGARVDEWVNHIHIF